MAALRQISLKQCDSCHVPPLLRITSFQVVWKSIRKHGFSWRVFGTTYPITLETQNEDKKDNKNNCKQRWKQCCRQTDNKDQKLHHQIFFCLLGLFSDHSSSFVWAVMRSNGFLNNHLGNSWLTIWFFVLSFFSYCTLLDWLFYMNLHTYVKVQTNQRYIHNRYERVNHTVHVC